MTKFPEADDPAAGTGQHHPAAAPPSAGGPSGPVVAPPAGPGPGEDLDKDPDPASQTRLDPVPGPAGTLPAFLG